MVREGYWRPQEQNWPLSPNFLGLQGSHGNIKMAHGPIDHLNGLAPLEGSRTIKILTYPKMQGRFYELDSEEVEVVPNSAGYPSNTLPYQPPSKTFQSQVIPSTPRTFQPNLATIPSSITSASPHSSHIRRALNPEVGPSPIQQPRNNSNLQPVSVEEEKNFLPCHFLILKCFSVGIDGLSELPEKIQIQ
ncbi:hypothetical protein O181_028759 [Austropuccinia psidii MF-1]|uniref:Uncharacterized protein n=1 Tax=Austropuccinia psidii MF-1 TaxID=1389203 RepID=A0A9Q3CPL5_9BASI|nr:hypothetical protein [Austropuccinia psidii MF-1]